MGSSAKYSLKQSQARQEFKRALTNLSGISWQEKPEQYCDYRMDGSLGGGWLRAKQFTNGTLYLEAASDELLQQMTQLLNGQSAAQAAPVRTAGTASPVKQAGDKPSGLIALTGDYIGTDESGKGDYFGPLVIAGVLVNEKTAAILTELGVMDSKKLTDKIMQGLNQQIIQTVGPENVSVVEIGPARYNDLYDKFKSGGKNLNHLLAWGHATVIENLLGRAPGCTQAIADQFGNENYIKSQLKEKGKGITLHQVHRAEANAGVAAASIMARNRFVKKLQQLGTDFGVNLPPGAGPQVKAQARLFIAAHGKEALKQVAKLHFKTTQELI